MLQTCKWMIKRFPHWLDKLKSKKVPFVWLLIHNFILLTVVLSPQKHSQYFLSILTIFFHTFFPLLMMDDAWMSFYHLTNKKRNFTKIDIWSLSSMKLNIYIHTYLCYITRIEYHNNIYNVYVFIIDFIYVMYSVNHCSIICIWTCIFCHINKLWPMKS